MFRVRLCEIHVVILILSIAGLVHAEVPLNSAINGPTPSQDDATLHDIQFVGSNLGWAVGDRGVVWKTEDGGRSWRFLKTPAECSLRKVCFLTDRFGWIAGGGSLPFTGIGYGIVLATQDGGETWRRIDGDQLPELHWIEFFGTKDGIVVGAASSGAPTGVFVTHDGGQSWKPVAGRKTQGWRTADFLDISEGVLAGMRGHVALVGGQQLLPTRSADLGIHGLHAVALQPDQTGWLVGDGALALRTSSGGVVWEGPESPLPRGLSDIVDFHAVACRGNGVWMAGSPGSVVWHSPDGGRTWQKQLTHQFQPIRSLTFPTDATGYAAGVLGTILKTEDAGATWHVVRCGDRRAAYQVFCARPDQVPLTLLSKYSADLGYRGTVTVLARRDVGVDGELEHDSDLRLREAVVTAGGSEAGLNWRLPIVLPDLDRNESALIAEWNLWTEGRLSEILVGDIVCRLRTWRPSVVILGNNADDVATRILNNAVLTAVDRAADPTQFPDQIDLAGLQPWRVRRVFQSVSDNAVGQVHLDAHELLPRVGATADESVAAVRSLLNDANRPAFRTSYRLVRDTATDSTILPAVSDFWAGFVLAPGSAARRELFEFDETLYSRQLAIARRQRNFHAYTDRFLDDARHANQLIAQFKDVTKGLSEQQAALQLKQLADAYKNRSNWPLAELTLVELVQQYPRQPVAQEAMRWLFQWWASAELGWQRNRKTGANSEQRRTNVEQVATNIQQQLQQLKKDPASASLSPVPVTRTPKAASLLTATNRQWVETHQNAKSDWSDRAFQIGKWISQNAPRLYATPAIQFPLAALMRQRGSYRVADELQRRYQTAGEGDPWRDVALTEMWLVQPVNAPPKPIAVCRLAAERPYLDGVLSDACWQAADEMTLTANGTYGTLHDNAAFVLLSHDAEYLYFAASMTRVPGTRNDGPQYDGRVHDADLHNFDRVSLFLDIDRDYTTYYALHIDQRGWTAESCWEDTHWNPQLHIAAKGDSNFWRIEVAIPLEEIGTLQTSPDATWAVGVVRTVPAIGTQSWTRDSGNQPGPRTFGLMQFR